MFKDGCFSIVNNVKIWKMTSIPKTKLEAILEALLYKSQDKYIYICVCIKVFMCIQMYANLYIHIHIYAYMNIEKSKNKKGHT